MEEKYKEVRFDCYCESCKHKNLEESDDICHECLNEPVNLYSHRPVNYEEQ